MNKENENLNNARSRSALNAPPAGPRRPRRRGGRGKGNSQAAVPTQVIEKTPAPLPARTVERPEPPKAAEPLKDLPPVKQILHTSAFHVPRGKLLNALEKAGKETNNPFCIARLQKEMSTENYNSFMVLIAATIDHYIKDNEIARP